MDRYKILAERLIKRAIYLKKGERLLIETNEKNDKFVPYLINESKGVGVEPIIYFKDLIKLKNIIKFEGGKELEKRFEIEKEVFKNIDAYIGIRGGHGLQQFLGLPFEKIGIYQQSRMERFEKANLKKTSIIRYPNKNMAYDANMSLPDFENFYFKACDLNYPLLGEKMKKLESVMTQTDEVRILAPDTDLTFSIKGIPGVGCDGIWNIPDGEVSTAPTIYSAKGYIKYNVPTPYAGMVFKDVALTLKDGKIVKANANYKDALNYLLDLDEGNRFIGEFALGTNPYIDKPINDILFDEKIHGSFHFTPGKSNLRENPYKTSIHWDMVSILNPEYGGGEIYFDNKLIQKDGEFVIPELKHLNKKELIDSLCLKK